jgi:flagellar hook assembly protein FlgD
VRLTIYDVAGRTVRSWTPSEAPSGEHRVRWDGRDDAGRAQAPGVYFARLVAGETVDVRKILRVR